MRRSGENWDTPLGEEFYYYNKSLACLWQGHHILYYYSTIIRHEYHNYYNTILRHEYHKH